MSRKWTFLAWPLIVVPQVLQYLGALMNQIAMTANKGRMPVLWVRTWEPDDIHSLMTPFTHLKFLCDWINLHTEVCSPGDVLLYLSDAIVGPLFWAWLTIIVYKAFRREIQSGNGIWLRL